MFKFLMLTLAISFGIQTVAHIALYQNLIISAVSAICAIAYMNEKKGGK